jgi:hypothetical protein
MSNRNHPNHNNSHNSHNNNSRNRNSNSNYNSNPSHPKLRLIPAIHKMHYDTGLPAPAAFRGWLNWIAAMAQFDVGIQGEEKQK